MDFFVKIGNSWNPLTISSKSSILDFWLASWLRLYRFIDESVFEFKSLALMNRCKVFQTLITKNYGDPAVDSFENTAEYQLEKRVALAKI